MGVEFDKCGEYWGIISANGAYLGEIVWHDMGDYNKWALNVDAEDFLLTTEELEGIVDKLKELNGEGND